MTNGEDDDFTIPVSLEPEQTISYDYPVVVCSGIFTLSAPEIDHSTTLEKYCEVSFEETTQKQQIINVGSYSVGQGKYNTESEISISAREFGQTQTVSARTYVDAYMLIESTSGGYYQKKLELSYLDTIIVERDKRIRILSKPYGLCFKNIISESEFEYIKLDNYVVKGDLNLELQLPIYTWEDLNETNEVKHYSCTAKCLVYDWVAQEEQTKTATVTTKSVTDDGTISREITQRATTKEIGYENLVAEFSATEVFVKQTRENVEIPMVVEKHEHGGIVYDKILTAPGGKLPTTSGNYYLDSDVAVTAVATIPTNVEINICLNGYAIYYSNKLFNEFLTEENANTDKTFYINQGTLNISDCHKGDEACRHYFNNDSGQ